MLFDNLVPAEDEDNNDVILEVRAGITAFVESAPFSKNMSFLYVSRCFV